MSDLTQNELEARLLYSIVVAGKSAAFADKALMSLNTHSRGQGPFDMCRRLIAEDYLERALQLARTGNYTKVAKAVRQLVASAINVRDCTVDELEVIHGIGPKTARFFIIWTRPGARHAALDVHVLRWLREQGYDAPKTTPTGEKYKALEEAFLNEADKRGMTARELDYSIWQNGSGYISP